MPLEAAAPGNLDAGKALTAAARPGEIDRALPRWLPPSIGSRTEAVTRYRRAEGAAPEDPPSDPYVADYRLAEGAPLKDARAALAILERLDAPGRLRDYGETVKHLKLTTKWRQVDDAELTDQVELFARMLAEYPLDVARAACRDWADGNVFFPAWAELRALCEAGALYRRGLARALRAYIAMMEERARAAELAEQALIAPETPANQVWRDHKTAIVATLGQHAWDTWLVDCIPHADDGETFTLACYSKFAASYVKESYGEVLEEILGRRLTTISALYVSQAKRSREAKDHAAQQAAPGDGTHG